MALSAFDDKTSPPGDRALEEMLGRAGSLWARLKNDLQAAYGPLSEEWNFSGKAGANHDRLAQTLRRSAGRPD